MRKVLLVADYPLDCFRSMDRYVSVLKSGLESQGLTVQTISPRQIIPDVIAGNRLIAKWTGYVSKFLLFPFELSFYAKEVDVVHICDHHNSPYTMILQSRPHVVTCHDMIGIKAALKESSPAELSKLGPLLHKFNLFGLKKAQMVACVSASTAADVVRLAGKTMPDSARVIENALDPIFSPMSLEQANIYIEPLGITKTDKFLLMIGSGLKRKNREAAVNALARVKDKWTGKLVMAGAPIPQSLMGLARDLGISNRLLQVVNPVDTILRALYSRAVALVFPSLEEGFGWPVIEAQACRCPVICSDVPPLPQVAGTAAILVKPTDIDALAESIMKLCLPEVRENLILAGIHNAARFSQAKLSGEFAKLYEELIERHKHEQ